MSCSTPSNILYCLSKPWIKFHMTDVHNVRVKQASASYLLSGILHVLVSKDGDIHLTTGDMSAVWTPMCNTLIRPPVTEVICPFRGHCCHLLCGSFGTWCMKSPPNHLYSQKWKGKGPRICSLLCLEAATCVAPLWKVRQWLAGRVYHHCRLTPTAQLFRVCTFTHDIQFINLTLIPMHNVCSV